MLCSVQIECQNLSFFVLHTVHPMRIHTVVQYVHCTLLLEPHMAPNCPGSFQTEFSPVPVALDTLVQHVHVHISVYLTCLFAPRVPSDRIWPDAPSLYLPIAPFSFHSHLSTCTFCFLSLPPRYTTNTHAFFPTFRCSFIVFYLQRDF